MLLYKNDPNAGVGRHKATRHDLYWLLLLSVPLISSYRIYLLWYALYAFGVLMFLALSLLLYSLRWPKPQKVALMRASPFQQDAVPTNLDTIVIGSGSGGSTCANLLSQSGQRVLVLEQHPTVTGGCTHSFREENCEWDTGLHYTSKDMSRPTARPGAIMDFMSHGGQHWTPLDDPYDEILFPKESGGMSGLPNNNSYPFVSGAIPTVEGIIAAVDPGNDLLHHRVATYMDICEQINSGFTALGVSRLLPSSLQFLVRKRVDRLMKYASFTVREVQHAVLKLGFSAEDIIASEKLPDVPDGPDPDYAIRRLKGILCHPIGDYAVQPREATMAAHGVTMSHYMDGASYTVGATQNLSIRLTSAVRNFGGEVFVDATVLGIIVESGRAVGVRVCNTSSLEKDAEPLVTEIRAKNIVCATSVYNLYNKFLPPDLPIVQKFADPHERTVRQSNGHVFLFCKLKGDATELGLPTHNLWYFNNYDLDTAFDEYFKDPTAVRPPTVYIGFPCTKDTTWKRRFPGVSNCLLISDGLYEWFEKWADEPHRNRGKDYMAFKEKLSKHLLDILFESVPQVRGKVEFHHLGTPLTEVTYLSSWHGGSYGTKCTPEMFAPRNHKWTTTPHTEIDGLYLAGSDAFLPSVVGAMYGGCLGACAVLGKLGTTRLTMAILGHMSKNIRREHSSMSYLQSYKEAFFNMFQKDDGKGIA